MTVRDLLLKALWLEEIFLPEEEWWGGGGRLVSGMQFLVNILVMQLSGFSHCS